MVKYSYSNQSMFVNITDRYCIHSEVHYHVHEAHKGFAEKDNLYKYELRSW